MISRTGAGVLAAALLALAPPGAGAATLVATPSTMTYQAGPGIENNLGVSRSTFGPFTSFFEQAGDPITVSGSSAGSCTGSGTTTVTCNYVATSVVIAMGSEDLTDRVEHSGDAATASVLIDGGPGDDVLGGSATLLGGNGNDRLVANNNGANMQGGAGDDTMRGADGQDTFTGGPGNDTADYSSTSSGVRVTIDDVRDDGGAPFNDDVRSDTENVVGGPSDDTLSGTAGSAGVANRLDGGAGDDTLNGLDGNDRLDGGPGSDTLSGGSGSSDAVSYETRAAAVSVTMEGARNDGEAGERDLVGTDIERAFGGFGDDYLAGQSTAVTNRLVGGMGDDILEGNAGNDTLEGGPGRDSASGGAGNDTISGNAGDDTLDGADGNDSLDGGTGIDVIDAGLGTDTVAGGDGPDRLLLRDAAVDNADCGAGSDVAVADGADSLTDCESVETTGGGPFAAAAPAARGDTAAPASLRVVVCTVAGRRSGSLSIACRMLGASGATTLRARLVRGGRTYAVARRTRAGGRTTFRLRAVRRTRAGAYRLVVTSGSRTVATVPIRLR
jgi:Ca2+-binding RTX toxin-like protein